MTCEEIEVITRTTGPLNPPTDEQMQGLLTHCRKCLECRMTIMMKAAMAVATLPPDIVETVTELADRRFAQFQANKN